MRPILTHIGPLEPWAYPIVVGVATVFVVAWRYLARRMGEPFAPLTVTTGALAFLGVCVGSAAIYALINAFGPVEIKSYGTMLVLGFAAGIWWMARSAPRDLLSLADVLDFALFALVGGILGARLLFVGLNWAQYAGAPGSAGSIWEGGLSFHGGVGGALLATAIYSRWRGKPFWRVCDAATPSIAIGYAITRIGCFLNGCCYGAVTISTYGVHFPGADLGGVYTLRHPTQLYAAGASLLIFCLLATIVRRDRSLGFQRAPGQLFFIYLLFYSVYRFLVEFLRRGATAVPFAPIPSLTDGQVASVGLALVAVAVIAATRSRRLVSGLRRSAPAAPRHGA